MAAAAGTRRFTYGYGRAEDLAGLVRSSLIIAASAVLAAWEAIDRLLDPQAVAHLSAVAVAGVIGFAGNEIVARYRIRVGREIGSAALVADGLHARTDGFTSLAVLVGAAGVAIGWPWADPVVGLADRGRDPARAPVRGRARCAARLMDAVDPALVRRRPRRGPRGSYRRPRGRRPAAALDRPHSARAGQDGRFRW